MLWYSILLLLFLICFLQFVLVTNYYYYVIIIIGVDVVGVAITVKVSPFFNYSNHKFRINNNNPVIGPLTTQLPYNL